MITNMNCCTRIEPPIRGLSFNRIGFGNHANLQLRNHSTNLFRFIFNNISFIGIHFSLFLLVPTITLVMAFLATKETISRKLLCTGLLEFLVILDFENLLASTTLTLVESCLSLDSRDLVSFSITKCFCYSYKVMFSLL